MSKAQVLIYLDSGISQMCVTVRAHVRNAAPSLPLVFSYFFFFTFSLCVYFWEKSTREWVLRWGPKETVCYTSRRTWIHSFVCTLRNSPTVPEGFLGLTGNAAKKKWLISFRLSEPKYKVIFKMSNINLWPSHMHAYTDTDKHTQGVKEGERESVCVCDRVYECVSLNKNRYSVLRFRYLWKAEAMPPSCSMARKGPLHIFRCN